ncbi:unnamed protein product, partial [Ascophyllum nodosum]
MRRRLRTRRKHSSTARRWAPSWRTGLCGRRVSCF